MGDDPVFTFLCLGPPDTFNSQPIQFQHLESCASLYAYYVGEISRHFSIRVRKHLLSDRSSNVFRHVQSSESCRTACTLDCFEILDSAATKCQVKLKDLSLQNGKKPDLNLHVKHIT